MSAFVKCVSVQLKVTFIQSSSSHAVWIADGHRQCEIQSLFYFCRDISKNAHLGFKPFLYWTILGFFHVFVFFYGSYLLMGEDTSLLGNGQVQYHKCYSTIVFLVIFLNFLLKNPPVSEKFCFYELHNYQRFFVSICVCSQE